MLLICILFVGIATAKTINTTVYRITPRNYTGLTNFDSGSAGGDAFFGIYELQAPLVCSNKKAANYNLLCRNEPILQIPGFNVYTRTIIEMDERTGDYSECNPDQSTGIFACQHFHYPDHEPPVCWFNSTDNPEWKTSFNSECDLTICKCDAVEKKSVGREITGNQFGSGNPKDWPQQCLDNFYAVDGYIFGGKSKPTKILTNTNEGDCCNACAFEKRGFLSGCGGYTWEKVNQTCSIFSIFDKPHTPAPPSSQGLVRSGFNLKGTPYWSVLGSTTTQIALTLNGSWWSTRASGECKTGERPNGNGNCWWRIVKQTSNVNASCVNGNLIAVVKNSNQGCWDACTPSDRANMRSTCFIQCFFETAAGNKTKGWLPMSRSTLINAFESSFDTCPQIKPCPPPCLPPVQSVDTISSEGEVEVELIDDKEDNKVQFPVDVWFFDEIVKQGKFYFTKKGGSGRR